MMDGMVSKLDRAGAAKMGADQSSRWSGAGTSSNRSALSQTSACTEAVILAAGRGSRLEHLTDAKPKCLVEIGGVPLIEHQMRMLEMAGVDRITVVAGYRDEELRRVVGDRARVIQNDAWSDTNSLYSLSLCRQCVDGPMLVMNCDVLVHPLALRRLLDTPGSAFLYDSYSGDSEEEMKVELTGDGCLRAMSKTLPLQRTHGENVGVLRFDAIAARALFRSASSYVARGHRNSWMALAVASIARKLPLQGVDIADLPWIEIDFPEDLERACTQVWRWVAPALLPRQRLAA